MLLSLAQIHQRYGGAGRTPKRGVRDPSLDNEDDVEFEDFLKLVRSPMPDKEVGEFLMKKFQGMSQEPGKCVEYLRKLIIHSYELSKKNRRNSDRCVTIIFTSLFEMAQVTWSLPSQTIDDMMVQGMNAVKDYSSSVLAEVITKYCIVELAKMSVSVTTRWIELFGRFISVLNERGDIPFEETDTINGTKFRESVVEEICRMQWDKNNITWLLVILEEIPGLQKYESSIIIENYNKFLREWEQSWGHQVIHSSISKIVGIVGNFHAENVLKVYDGYITRLWKEDAQFGEDILPPPSERRGKRYVPKPKVSLATVVNKFVESSRNCDPIMKEIMKRTRAAMFDHTLVMTPFNLAVVLAMTNVDHLRMAIVDALKTAILKSYHETNVCNRSSWYKSVIGNIPDDIMESFNLVLRKCDSSMDYMSDGIKELGFSLLGSGGHTTQWRYPGTYAPSAALGSRLVEAFVMSNKEQLGLIMKELLKPDSPEHIECLAVCLKKCSVSVAHRNFQGRISELFQYLPATSVEAASLIIKSLMPSIRMFPQLLDDLMIVLRKTFWKSVEAGRVCVEIMCVVLCKSLAVGSTQILGAMDNHEDDLIFSQCTQNTSISSSRTTDFSPLCHEILDLAKRFFQLDIRVREQLYLGLHRVARRNPVLNDIICGQVHSHLLNYLSTAQNKVIFEQLFEFTPTNSQLVKVKDELGFLVQCLGFVYNKSQALDEGTASRRNCKEALNQLIVFACEIDCDSLEIMTSSIIDNASSQLSQQQQVPDKVVKFVNDTIFMQTMQICEALLEFLATTDEWEEAKKKVKLVFRKYQDIEKYCKEAAQAPKKKGEKGKGKGNAKVKLKGKNAKKADDADDDVLSVTSGTTQTTAAPGSSKKTEPTLKPSPYFRLINLDTVGIILRQLYATNTKDALQHVKGHDDFELLLLRTCLDKISLAKSHQSIRERPRERTDFINTLTVLADTIWLRFCQMNTERHDENTEVVEVRLEVILRILELLLAEGHRNLVLLLGRTGRKTIVGEESMLVLRDKFFADWKTILKMVSTTFDGVAGKGAPMLFGIIHTFCKVLPNGDILKEMHQWTWDYLHLAKPDNATTELLIASVDFYLTINTKCFDHRDTHKDRLNVLKLAKYVHLTLGDIDEETQADKNRNDSPWLIKKETVQALLSCICAFVENQINMLTTILGRLKAHKLYLGDDKSLEMRESCIINIRFLRRIMTHLVCSAFPAGACVVQMLKLVTQFYNMLSSFAEHYVEIHKHTSEACPMHNFSRLVSELGQELKPKIDAMIQHIEVIQRQGPVEAPRKNKTRKGANTLKHKLSKDAKYVPNMIYQIEMFDKYLIALSKKRPNDRDLLVGMKLSTARDFRVMSDKFKDALREANTTTAPDEDPEQEPEPASKRGKKRKNED